MTAERSEQVDFAGPYFYASIVCVTKKDSPYATATSIADLAGGTCTSQSGTIWYDSCLPQIENTNLLAPADYFLRPAVSCLCFFLCRLFFLFCKKLFFDIQSQIVDYIIRRT